MDTLGIVETNSIAAGVEAGDIMMKTAFVKLESAQPTCPGKYVIMISGDTAAVTASVNAGKKIAADSLVNSIVISSLHEQVIPALACATVPEHKEAVGVIETFSIAAAVIAADAAVKAADVELIEIRLGRGLGGKSFVLLCGGTAEVKAAVSAAKNQEDVKGLLLRTVVIPALHEDMLAALM